MDDNGLEVFSNDGLLDIIPSNEYDPFEAKFCSSLFWLVFHATEDGGLEDVPSQVTTPTLQTGKNGFVVHPEIVQFLTKGEVYCTVCSRVFPGKVALAGHWSVIQTLSRNGVYVVDSVTDIAVTDSALEQTNPFNQGAHIALMDALMTAYSSQVVSIQAVVQAVRRFSTFSASRELPFDLEDALLLWINKLSTAVNGKHVKLPTSSPPKLLRGREQERKIGIRKDTIENTAVAIPTIDDLLKGLCDGRSLLAIVLFYEPNVITVEDIFTSDEVSIEDSIRNLDLFRTLCSQYFCTSVLALKVEDILYGSPSLKINIVALLAEMFSKCERETKPAVNILRSRTSCSENTPDEVNGHGEIPRTNSAPVSRNRRDISLKVQNYVENVGSSEDLQHGEEQSKVDVRRPEEEGEECDQDMVEVDGVVVKLRKKMPRDVQPGGGHDALLSRRMKKSLFSSSHEDVSNEASPVTGDPEDKFDLKSDEVYEKNEPKFPEISDETKEPDVVPMPNGDMENLDLSSIKETPHSFELDFGSLPGSGTPIDMLSPISETTEPGSLGNSLNASMMSARGIHFPTADVDSGIRHQTEKQNEEVGHEVLAPPISQTPRKMDDQNQSSHDGAIPRGSYVINASYTVESAVAAGIPVVERESMASFRSNAGSERSLGDGVLSRFPGKKVNKSKELPGLGFNGSDVPVVPNEQQGNEGDQNGTDNEHFSTYRKDKSSHHENDSDHPKYSDKTFSKTRGNQGSHGMKIGHSDPPITWFVGNDDVGSQKDHGSRKHDGVGHVAQRATVDTGARKTSWARAEDGGKHQQPTKKD